MKMLMVTVVTLALAMLSGCTTYYRVTDPDSGSVYYTNRLSGTVKFTDARSGKRVTLASSEVQAISKARYDSAIRRKH